MTRFFNLLANLLFPIRYLLIVISLMAFIAIWYLLVFSSQQAQTSFLTPSLLIFLWGLILFVLCQSFHGAPSVTNSSLRQSTNTLSWFARVKRKLSLLFLWFYSLIFLLLMMVSLYVSLKVWMQ
jgi:hypothetical protein